MVKTSFTSLFSADNNTLVPPYREDRLWTPTVSGPELCKQISHAVQPNDDDEISFSTFSPDYRLQCVPEICTHQGLR